MRKQDGKSTLNLEAQVCELQGKTITNKVSFRKVAASVSSGQVPRQSRRDDLTSDPMVVISELYLQELSNKYYDKDQKGPASSQVEERDNCIYWTLWI